MEQFKNMGTLYGDISCIPKIYIYDYVELLSIQGVIIGLNEGFICYNIGHTLLLLDLLFRWGCMRTKVPLMGVNLNKCVTLAENGAKIWV